MPNKGAPAPLLSAAQAAARLGVHPETVRRWGRTGRVSCAVLPSGRRRYPSASIDRLLRELETPAHPLAS